MLIKLNKQAKPDQKNKQVLVLSDYRADFAWAVMDKDKRFMDCSFVFVDDLKKVEWQLSLGLFDYLYAPLEKTRFIDKRLFTHL